MTPLPGISAADVIRDVAYGDLKYYPGRSEAGARAVIDALRAAGFVIVQAADVLELNDTIDDGMCAAKADHPSWGPWGRLREAVGLHADPHNAPPRTEET
jgi:hypothetical protein